MSFAFTNAVLADAERDGAQWLKEWKEEQSRYKLVTNRLKAKNFVIWNPNKNQNRNIASRYSVNVKLVLGLINGNKLGSSWLIIDMI